MSQLKQLIQEIHRRSLWQVLAIYLAISWVVYEVVQSLTEGLGLPQWFPAFAFVLILIGLPIVVATAFVQEGISATTRQDPTLLPGAELESEARPREVAGARRLFTWRNAITGGVLALALWGVVATGWLLFGGSAAASDEDVDDRSIAVLPFDDFSSGSDQEWFAAGMQEALITALHQIGALRVTSRTSAMLYKETGLSSREIADELRTRWLVEGSVLRDGDRIRISAQLIDGSRDEHLWAEQYERDVEYILALQNDVARAIAAEIDVALTPAEERRLAAAPRVEPEMYGAYVLGLHHLYRITPGDFRKSISYFEEAIALDSTFAPAQAALAVSYATGIEYDWISKEEVGEAAERAAPAAIRLDPESSEAYHALGSVEFHVRHDFPAAERAFRNAIARNPTAYALQDYGWLLSQSGRYEEAVSTLERAVLLDPRSALMRTDLGWWRFGARDLEGALEEGLKAGGMDPTYGEAHWLLSTVYAHMGRFDQAYIAFDRYQELYGEPIPWFRGYLLGLEGRREEALELARELRARVDRGESSLTELAAVYVATGDHELALAALEEAEKGAISFLPYLLPQWEPLFSSPRFLAVLERFGLPPPPDR